MTDTNHGVVWAWIWAQRPYLDLYEHHVLGYLAFRAHVTESNQEDAPVGQVLHGYSSIQKITDGTRLSKSKVQGVLWDLQAEHGYIRRLPRRGANPHSPHVIRVLWTPEADDAREAARRGERPLPDDLRLTPQDIAYVWSFPKSEQAAVLKALVDELSDRGPQHGTQGAVARTPGVRSTVLRGPWHGPL